MLSDTLPRYKNIKRMILARIRSGEWPPDHRIPSENQLMATYGVSKMTAERALCELAREGELVRFPRIGSFVARTRRCQISLEFTELADVIRTRGNVYSARIVHLAQVPVPLAFADELGLGLGSTVYHSIVVHNEDGVPVQLEDRFVLPAVAPGYLTQDFSAQTPHACLLREICTPDTTYSVQAVVPQPWERTLLALLPAEPCLSIEQRILMDSAVMSVARYVFSSSRHRMRGSADYRN
ncbi:UTRA domain-containing protein [Rhizobium sp. WW_1]|nr:UTRA domain-containing protein [Rhizobium sp. WW_1]